MREDAEARRLVEAWTTGLDREDFESLAPLLTVTCAYRSPNGVLVGPGAILSSYRRNAVWAHETFDEIRWESAIRPLSSDRFEITFTDRTRHRGERHVYRCRQRVALRREDADWRIAEIEHVAIPEEEKALAAFFERHGVKR